MGKKLKVFVIWGSFPPSIGGGAARGYRIYKALSDRGYNVTVFVVKPPGAKVYERVSLNFQVVRVPPSRRVLSSRGGLSWFLSVVTSTVRYVNLYLFLLYFYLRQKPDIIIKEAPAWIFDSNITRYFGLDIFFLASRISPWILIKKLAHAPLVVYFTRLWQVPRRYYRDSSYSADKIIVVDEWMKNILKDIGNKNSIYYLPVCIDTNEFQLIGKPMGNQVLFVGRLGTDRGCDTLIKAAPEIIRKVPDCRITIVGNGSQMPVLKRMAEQSGVMSHVEFIGAIDPRQVKEVYRGAKVFVNPMRVPGIGNVTIEAMACGIPVVKSAIDGYHEYIVRDGEDGYLFKIDDYLDLADKVIKILQHSQWETLSRAARTTAMQFDIEASVDRLEKIISSTTSEQRM